MQRRVSWRPASHFFAGPGVASGLSERCGWRTQYVSRNAKGRGRQKYATAPPPAQLLVVIGLRTERRLLHLHEELDVALGLPDLVGQQLKALLRFESGEDAAQLPHDLDFLGREEVLLAPGAGGVDVH